MTTDELPPSVVQFVQRLNEAGFQQVASEKGSMDSGRILFRRSTIAVSLLEDRAQWSLDVMVDGWRDSVSFPLLDGFGHPARLATRFPHVAAGTERPTTTCRTQSAGSSDSSSAQASPTRPTWNSKLDFQREPVTVRLDRDSCGWSVRLCVEGNGPDVSVALPPFEGFADS